MLVLILVGGGIGASSTMWRGGYRSDEMVRQTMFERSDRNVALAVTIQREGYMASKVDTGMGMKGTAR